MNSLLAQHVLPAGPVVQMVHGDITTEEVDAVVNAANERLQHGGGVAWAISKKGGPAIQQESDAWVRKHGHVSHARPAWTSGGRLPVKYVIHAVGPIWGEGDEDNRLEAAVTGSLQVADELGCASIALPAISTGIYGFPGERAATIIFRAIEKYFAGNPASGLKVVRLTLYDPASVDVFFKAWQSRWGKRA